MTFEHLAIQNEKKIDGLPGWTDKLTSAGKLELDNFIRSSKSEGLVPEIPRNPFLTAGSIWMTHYTNTSEYQFKAARFFGESKNNQQGIGEVLERIATILGDSYYEDNFINQNIKALAEICVKRKVLSLEILNRFLNNLGTMDADMLQGLLRDLGVLADELLFQFVEGKVDENKLDEIRRMIGTVSISQLFSELSDGESLQSSRGQFV